MSLRSRDTSLQAHDIQLEIWRQLWPTGRLALSIEMSEALRDITRAGIRRRHPECAEPEVELALRHLMWGDALFFKVYPNAMSGDAALAP